MIRIKVCGITRYEDAKIASTLGIDAIGFVFYNKSKRFIMPYDAAEIIRSLPPFIATVGVFVNESLDTIKKTAIVTGITTFQLHGEEPPDFCQRVPGRIIKAFQIHDGFDFSIIKRYHGLSAFLLDAWDEELKGGTGKTVDWSAAAKAHLYGNLILSGGLNPGNIHRAIQMVEPYGVDINSGVELMPGKKNPVKMKQVVDVVRGFQPKI